MPRRKKEDQLNQLFGKNPLSVKMPPLAPPDDGNPNNSETEQNDEGASVSPKAKRRQKKTSHIAQKARQLARDAMGTGLALRRDEGATLAELAKEFAMNTSNVSRHLKRTRENEILETARGIIAERLIPKALAVVDRELSKGNYNAARDVLNGSTAYMKSSKHIVEDNTLPTLDQIRAERLKKNSIDAEVIEKKTHE